MKSLLALGMMFSGVLIGAGCGGHPTAPTVTSEQAPSRPLSTLAITRVDVGAFEAGDQLDSLPTVILSETSGMAPQGQIPPIDLGQPRLVAPGSTVTFRAVGSYDDDFEISSQVLADAVRVTVSFIDDAGALGSLVATAPAVRDKSNQGFVR